MNTGLDQEQSAPLPLGRGDVVLGKYRIERVLGVGGMGVVYAALNMRLDQRVALKLLLPEAIDKKDVVARFAREARAAAKIQSEHVARVIDVGVAEPYGPFMVLELLEGRDLADTLDRDGALSIELAVGYVLEACEAVAEAHSLGIVHRDLKPENLFLARRADSTLTVKVLDFGISKVDPAAGASASLLTQASITQTSSVMGSPMYMSPEQLRGSRSVNARSDIWSLGVTLYELLTCEGPFPWGTVPELCASVLKDAPKPLREKRPEVPEALEHAVMKCLEKAAEDRFATVGELAEALAPFAPATGLISCGRISRLTLRPPPAPPPEEPQASSPAPPSSLRRERRRPPVSEPPEALIAASEHAAATGAAWDSTRAPARPPRTSAIALALIAVIGVVLLAGIALMVRRSHPPVTLEAPSSIAVASPSPAPPPGPVAEPEPQIAPPSAPALSSATAETTATAITPTAVPLHGRLPVVHRPEPSVPTSAIAAASASPYPAASSSSSKRSAFDDRK